MSERFIQFLAQINVSLVCTLDLHLCVLETENVQVQKLLKLFRQKRSVIHTKHMEYSFLLTNNVVSFEQQALILSYEKVLIWNCECLS